ncbi:UDP-N-acetylmuramoyl-tripeptide--D-alanyl-D- alanine ligase MurF [Bifidobacterium actinocoloniiforme DSM 22766]|uniref:UDP-N-acetylmuramoyl-tripeptide--D-alanyl-D-alanine ligase n=1 Tax=Bifidobacterium actinocoloniiforme DSM 22766 TaxID=1437605 RepID=A0A086YZR8_9BIFI|nr:UDP-N-acetylmuramoyl-tripeptide--D-alanyl-D- alanine ligase MurF [Bifidobacterium actinocoloniiforme DSM 22766]
MEKAERPVLMPMTLKQVAQAVHGRITPAAAKGGLDLPIANVTTDSRQVGPGSLFVAIAGERVDGHRFLGQAAEQGAIGALVSEEQADADLPQVVVEDTVQALGQLAASNVERRRALDAPFTLVAITGSVGKTTTKDLLAAMLAKLGPTVAPVGSFNNEIGLPLTALRVGPDTRYLVAEMGASQVGDIAYLTSIAPPDIAVVLKVGVAHLGVFGSVERIAQAKSELVRGLRPHGLAVLNADDERVAAMAQLAPGRVLRFGLGGAERPDDPGLDMTARDITTDDLDRPSFQLEARGERPVAASLALSGEHNVMNALAAACVAHELGLPLEDISASLSAQGRRSPHRMAVSQVEEDGARFTLIDDSFNANPDSMSAGLRALASWKEPTGGQDGAAQAEPYRVAVLGGMLELGEGTMDLHRQVGALCVSLGLDALVAVGGERGQLTDMAGAMVEGARRASAAQGSKHAGMRLFQAPDTGQADRFVRDLASGHPGCVVLLKGSHMSGLDALAERWQSGRFGEQQ